MTEHYCDFPVERAVALVTGAGDTPLCGLPATTTWRYPEGSAMYFCPKHIEKWIEWDENDLAKSGRGSDVGQYILATWRLNGIISR